MLDDFQYYTKNNPYLIHTVKKCEFEGEVVYVSMWNAATEDGDEFIDSSVYKSAMMEYLLDKGIFIKI
jgi:hypothetical protein